MRRSTPRSTLAALLTLFLTAGGAPSFAQDTAPPQADKVTGQDEEELSSDLVLRSSDGRLSIQFQGKIQNDWAFFSTDRDVEAVAGPFEDGTEFRRARLNLRGDYDDWLRFKLSYDFADGVAGIRDAYLEPRDLPVVGSFRLGHFKEPAGLENRTSSSYLTFLERSLATALAPGRNVGVMAFDNLAGKRMTWAAGIFRDTDSSAFGADEGGGKEFAGTGRITWLPWYDDKGRRLLHLGASLSLRNPDQGLARVRSRPEADLAPRIVDTGKFPAEQVRLGGIESALVLGPFSLQGEYLQTQARVTGSWQRFEGYYLQGSAFLTGEHRPYSRRKGVFSRVRPLSPMGGGGLGAVELAARYSRLDLRDSLVFGGSVQDLTLGANWYFNERLHLQVNYVISDLETFGNARILEARIHFDW